MPRPLVAGGPPIIIGGNDPNRTLLLAARYANEWNAIFVPAKRFSELSAHLDELLRSGEKITGAGTPDADDALYPQSLHLSSMPQFQSA